MTPWLPDSLTLWLSISVSHWFDSQSTINHWPLIIGHWWLLTIDYWLLTIYQEKPFPFKWNICITLQCTIFQYPKIPKLLPVENLENTLSHLPIIHNTWSLMLWMLMFVLTGDYCSDYDGFVVKDSLSALHDSIWTVCLVWSIRKGNRVMEPRGRRDKGGKWKLYLEMENPSVPTPTVQFGSSLNFLPWKFRRPW